MPPHGHRASNACVLSRVQAELGGAADRKQEDYRGYLLQRVLPAARREYAIPAGDGGSTYDVVSYDFLASWSTGELEARLAGYYDQLLMVRIAAMFEGWHLEDVEGLASSETGPNNGSVPGLSGDARHRCRKLESLCCGAAPLE